MLLSPAKSNSLAKNLEITEINGILESETCRKGVNPSSVSKNCLK